MLERIRKVINYLVYQGVIKNDTDLAAKLKYTKSSLSQILNGVVPADKFVEKLCKFDKNINYVWIVNGEGEMLHIPPTTQTVSGNGNHDNNMINSCSTSAVEKLIVEMAEQRKSYTAIIDKLIDKLEQR